MGHYYPDTDLRDPWEGHERQERELAAMGTIPDDEVRRTAIDHGMRRLYQLRLALKGERDYKRRVFELWKINDVIERALADLAGCELHDLPSPLEVPKDAVE